MNIIKLLLKSLIALTLILSQAQAASKTVFYHHDALGSIVSSTDEQGEVLWKEEYQPYGQKIKDTGNGDTVENQDWYTGKNYDTELDISYFGARWYDAKQGRFLSIDPVGVDPENIHSFNRYAYANNNPYKFVDPDGETPVDIIFVAIDAIKLGVAIQSGVGVGSAFADLGISIASLASPIPSAGQTYKASRAVSKVTKSEEAAISPQKQAGHLPGTPQNANRLKQGRPTSSFFGEKSGNRLTQQAFEKGKPVPRRPNVREHDFGVSTGTGPNGGMQSRVRVHQDAKGRIHGHPSGPER